MIELIRGAEFRADRAWGGVNLARLDKADLKVRWTDQPFRWHANQGQELFAVMSGKVAMFVREPGKAAEVIDMEAGDMLFIRPGIEHCAHPQGAAVLFVVEEPEA